MYLTLFLTSSFISFSQDQYVFIHDAILESMTCGDTQIEAGNLRRKLKKLQTRDESGRTELNLQFSVSNGNEVVRVYCVNRVYF